MIKSMISDPLTGISAEVSEERHAKCLNVKTVDSCCYSFFNEFFKDEDGSASLNIDASYGGTPIPLYAENAGTPTEWDASAISGTWDFAFTTEVYAGTYSIDGTETTSNNVMQLLSASPQDLTGYVAITGLIYITSWGAVGIKTLDIYGYDTATASIKGTVVDISDYVNTSSLNTWQQFSIPLGDMNLSGQTIDSIRIRPTNTQGVDQNFYLDNISIQETGGKSFFINKPLGEDKWLYISEINIFIADGMSGIVTVAGATENATLPNLSYNKILGLSELTIGIGFQIVQEEKVTLNYSFKSLSDFLSMTNLETMNYGGDGTNAWIKLSYRFKSPIVFKTSDKDYFQIDISEDLSGLLAFKISVAGRIEV